MSPDPGPASAPLSATSNSDGEVSEDKGTFLGGSYFEHDRILGYMRGTPILGNSHIQSLFKGPALGDPPLRKVSFVLQFN